MTDRELFVAIRSRLTALMAEQGLGDFPVVLGNATKKQGREKSAIYYNPISSPKRGWQSRKYSVTGGALISQETQVYEITFQVQAIALDGSHAAQDAAKVVRMLVSSLGFTGHLIKFGVTVQQPTDIRELVFTNEYDQYEPGPNFDFTVSFNRSINQEAPTVEGIEINTARVGPL